MLPITEIVTHLKADVAIAGLVGALVADHDVRRDREDGYFDADGDIRKCLVVTDSGELPFFGGPRAASQDMFYVWAFAPETPDGRTFIRTVHLPLLQALDDWSVPVTRQLIQYTRQRLGAEGGTVTDSTMDRWIFTAVGIHAGIAA